MKESALNIAVWDADVFDSALQVNSMHAEMIIP